MNYANTFWTAEQVGDVWTTPIHFELLNSYKTYELLRNIVKQRWTPVRQATEQQKILKLPGTERKKTCRLHKMLKKHTVVIHTLSLAIGQTLPRTYTSSMKTTFCFSWNEPFMCPSKKLRNCIARNTGGICTVRALHIAHYTALYVYVYKIYIQWTLCPSLKL